jgi:predicted DsbA family dithiol-disulfide isomerase
MQIDIWSDVVCPWCYIGKRRFESALRRFEHADEVKVRWRSFELDPRAPFRRSGNMAQHIAAKYGMTVDAARDRLEGMNRLAAEEGLRFDLARTQGGNTLDAHRLIHLGYEHGDDTGGDVKEALLHAYFEELLPVSDPDVLVDVATGCGIDKDEVCAVLAGDRFADAVRADEATAASLGATGVPFFVVNGAFAIPGAQDPDTFLAVLRRAWDRSAVSPEGGDACEGDSCPV